MRQREGVPCSDCSVGRCSRIEGKAMNLIQAQLGHSSLATTSRYLAHIAPAELVKAMQARTWSL